jgi:uncharacterized HhH-GPD family protein
MNGSLHITGDDAADHLLNTDGLALLIGMLLDQQVPMGWAFRGPATIRERLGSLDAAAIAAMDPESLVAICCGPPAIHRFPAVMARRIHELCRHLVEHHDGIATDVWQGAIDGSDLQRRLRALPGFGEEKTKIFIALLAKRFDVRPEGWEAAARPFSDDVPRSAADVDSPAALARVQEWKRVQRSQGKTKQD